MPREHLVQHHAERPEVDVLVDAAVEQSLRRHVRRRAPVVGGERLGLVERLRDAEVEDDDLAGVADEDVPRLQVGMHQPVVALAFDRRREAVRLLEEGADGRGMTGSRDADRAAPPAMTSDSEPPWINSMAM